MAESVLVHGAWQTASTWDLVIPKLRTAGHEVWIPLLSGLENDTNPLTPIVGLQTHIKDVIDVLTYENLRDVTEANRPLRLHAIRTGPDRPTSQSTSAKNFELSDSCE